MKCFFLILIFIITGQQAHAQFTASTTANKSYRAAVNIPIKLTFASAVTVTGVPQVALTIGSNTVYANYASGSGTTILTFNYTVAPGETDTDGIELSNNINLNGGTLKYGAGLDCTPTITSQTNISTVKVDTTLPSLLNVIPPADKVYYFGKIITFTANFSEPVLTAGPPQIAMNIGGTTVYATTTGYGTSAITFNYTVGSTDFDNDGVSISSPILLNTGLIKDAAGNSSSLSFSVPNTSGILVSGTSPLVLTSAGPADGTYNIGNNLDFTLNFNKPVIVTGAPTIPILLGSNTRSATYLSGSGTSSLVFRYTVVSGFPSPYGVYLNGLIDLNGGSIKDSLNNDAYLVYAKKNLPNVVIVAGSPSITSVNLPGSIPPGGYDEGQNIDFSVVFSEPITASQNTSRLRLTVGAISQYANYLSGSGTNTFIYRYTVGALREDLDGIQILSPLQLNLATLNSAGGAPVLLTFTPPDASSIKIDSQPPTTLSNTLPADGTYSVGQNLDFTVAFSENVLVTSNPRLQMNLGGTIRFADYLSGSGTSVLTFRYTVAASDNSAVGLTLINPVDLSLGSITDSMGHASAPSLFTLKTTGVLVFGQYPMVTSVTPPASQTYNVGEHLDFTFNFSRPVNVTGAPTIPMILGSSTRDATYLSGSGTSSLIFRYTVVSGFPAPAGIYMLGNIVLNGGTIKDLSNNDAVLTYPKKDLPDLIVLAPPPYIVSVNPPGSIPPAGYTVDQTIDFTVVFSEPMFASQNLSRLRLTIGGATQFAKLVSGSGTDTFVYRYKVFPFLEDTDGIQVTGPLSLSGSTITSANGSSTTLTFTSPNTTSMRVDSMLPSLVANTVPLPGNYSTGQNLNFVATYVRPVFVTGTPKFQILLGSLMVNTPRWVEYVSGSGTTQLTFRYTVAGGDLDEDGIEVVKEINTDDSTIVDSSGNSGTFWGSGVTLISFGTIPSKINANATIANVAAPANSTYKTNDPLDFTVSYSKVINVTGTPRIPVVLDGATDYASYVSGSGTNTLVFRYNVLSGHKDADGIALSSPVELNGGTLLDDEFIPASLNFTSPNTSSINVDGIDLAIASITPPADGTYRSGQNLDFTVNYNNNATVVGTPRLQLLVGAATVYADYVSGSGSSALLFRYTVTPGETDTDGINSIGPSIDLNSGTIQDAFGDNAAIAFTGTNYPNKKVDAVIPTISSVTGPASATYFLNDNLNFTVNFSKIITVVGSPRIQLTIGASTQYAVYLSGSGTSSAIFRYTVQAGDSDSDGIVSASPLQLNSGSIKDAAGNDVSPLTFSAPDTSSVNVDTAAASISSVNAPANAKYNTSNNLDFTVNFSRLVNVVGTPRLALTVGAVTRYATYLSGSGSSSLVFRYTVLAGHSDTDGIAVLSPLTLSGATIRDSSLNNATLVLTPPVTTGVLVDGIDVAIASITPPADGTYKPAQNMDFTVNYNYAATVVGSPRIQLTVGASTLYATYLSGSTTTAHVYRYTVAAAQLDTDGIDTVGPSIGLNGGTIKDAFGDDATLTFTAANYPNKKVDGVVPTISSVTGPANATYYQNENLDFIVNFSENVNVTNVPRIQLTIGATTKYATYVSGSGSSALTFRYTIVSPDTDANGIASVSPLQLNGGTILDVGGNALSPLTFSPPVTTGVIVLTAAATISSVTAPANATYKTGNNLDFVANFSRPVDVTGTPRISITAGAATVYANYLSGSGTNALTFRYTVVLGDSDNNGIALTSPIGLNGGTIQDSGNVNATLTFTPPATASVLVDGIDISIASITPPADGSYKLSQALNFTVNYNYAATVVGTPRIQLTVGASTLYATYVSGSTTTAHIYRYTVAAGNNDSDGITSVGPIGLNGGTVKDIFGDNADLSFTGVNYPNVKVDTTAPTIASMAVSADKTYITGESIDFTATYSEPVTITGTPRLTLTVGATTLYANYLSGTGTNSIVFRYTVAATNSDPNGIAVSTTLGLNAGTIVDAATNAQTVFTFSAPVLTGVRVDGIVPTIASVAGPASTTYIAGTNLDFVVNFSEAVAVVGSPLLAIDIGGVAKDATYLSGSGSASLTFRYSVVLNDNDSNGVATVSPLTLNSGTIKDLNLNNATLTFTSATYTGVKVDTTAPSVASVTLPANNTYQNAGARPTMSFTVVFDEAVTVTGTPRIHLTIGSTLRYANYASGSGTANIVFSYPVVAADFDMDGIAIANSSNIDLNGGTIRDALAQNANLGLGTNDTSNIFAIYPGMRNWYDLSDTNKITLSGGNVTVIQDKIGTYNLTQSLPGGVPYVSSGFNGGNDAYADCSAAGSFDGANGTTPLAIVAIFRAPVDVTSQYLFYAGGVTRPMLQFTSTAGGGTITSGVNGAQYISGAWGTNAATTGNFWSTDQVHARGFSWASTANRAQSVCEMTGELAEIIMFSVKPTQAQMTEIQNYINLRYGLTFP